jgi:hypothetical protein
MGNGCIDPRFLDLDTSQKLVVSFTLRPCYPRGESLDRNLRPIFGLDRAEKRTLLTLAGFELQVVSFPKLLVILRMVRSTQHF